MKHYGIKLLPITPDESKECYFIDNKREKKIRLKKEIPHEVILEMLLYPDQISQSEQEFFFAFSSKRGWLQFQGIIFSKAIWDHVLCMLYLK